MIEHWNWIYLWGIAAALNLYLHLFMSLFDGDALVSTGVDSRDGNTVGDDRKSSKQSKCK